MGGGSDGGPVGVTVRVVLTGPECTGKTTLAADLASAFGTPWLPEMARAYAAERAAKGQLLAAADVDLIAARAIAAEDAAEDAALAAMPPLLVLDTDLLSTVTYARHYYGASSAWLEGEARARRAQLYLLCAPDIPWIPDGIRDRPDRRDELFSEFDRVLTEFGADVTVVRGSGNARLAAAMAAVSGLQARA